MRFTAPGSLVFGGGHVVLPLLQAAVVPPGWVSDDTFLAGYGAAQAVPGPLFTFAAYLGAVMQPRRTACAGAAICLVAIFLRRSCCDRRAAVLADAAQPAGRAGGASRRQRRGRRPVARGALNPVWQSAVTAPRDFALALGAFLLLAVWKTPPWLVVVLCALGGAALAALT